MAIIKPDIARLDGQISLMSPAVGYYMEPPGEGVWLAEGAAIGKLQILNTIHKMVLPEGVCGKVCYPQELDKAFFVEYNQELFRLDQEVQAGESVKEFRGACSKEPEAIEEGQVIEAFITGIFYCKPSSDAPAYVEVGQEIEEGKILGLIEVMKTFYQLVFPGAADGRKATVKKIYVADAQEVKQGQKLFLVE